MFIYGHAARVLQAHSYALRMYNVYKLCPTVADRCAHSRNGRVIQAVHSRGDDENCRCRVTTGLEE
jgi:hypothetical protein